MTFFQDCSCESARAGMYELDNKSSIKNHRKRKQNQEEWWLKVKRPQQAFFLTLMGYERKTSLSIVRVGGRGCSIEAAAVLSHAILASYVTFLGTSLQLLSCSFRTRSNAVLTYSPTYLFHLLLLQRLLNSIFDFCRTSRIYFVYLFLLISFFIRRLFYSCQLLTWLFLCFFFLLAFVLLYCVRVKAR